MSTCATHPPHNQERHIACACRKSTTKKFERPSTAETGVVVLSLEVGASECASGCARVVRASVCKCVDH